MNYAFTTDDITPLTSEQKSALIESLVLAVLADGQAQPEEAAQFDREIKAVPWGMEDADVRRHLEAARQRFLELDNPDAAQALMTSIASRLPTASLREKVLHAVAMVLYATKKMNRQGATAFGALATAFELSREQLDAIKHSVKGG